MIEFTILELTLSVLCIGLFIHGMHYRSKAQSMCYLVRAMCHDDDALKQVKLVCNHVGEV